MPQVVHAVRIHPHVDLRSAACVMLGASSRTHSAAAGRTCHSSRPLRMAWAIEEATVGIVKGGASY